MKKIPFKTIWEVVDAWPEDMPLICLAGGTGISYLPLAFTEVDPDVVLRCPLVADPSPLGPGRGHFRSGFVGLISYDHFSPSAQTRARFRIFRVDRLLVFDEDRRELWYVGGDSIPHTWSLHDSNLVRMLERVPQPMPACLDAATRDVLQGILLNPQEPAESYRRKVEAALEDIRSGRYYQINLLRYFATRLRPVRRPLLRRLQLFGGPMSCIFDLRDLSVVSFSPETFVRLIPIEEGRLQAETRPIKGTASRSADDELDREAAQGLLESEKDLAELHMIVDLMRNDLARVSNRGSVRVPVAHELRSFSNVHHLEAVVTSQVRIGMSFGEFLTAICPGGSITGAPKIEVMKAIREYEGRDRGYFMGNAFYLDDSGGFSSSILIRTLVAQGGDPYQFAAGSGLVVRSDPMEEQREIDAKCRVVTASVSGV